MCGPTELMIAAFSGEVLKSRKKAAAAMAGIMSRPGWNRATIKNGIPRAMVMAETK